MSEALARTRNEPVLSRAAARSRTGHGLALVLFRRLMTLPARVYVVAAVSALIVGIGVNALLLQRQRHPAPLFAPARPQVSAAARTASPPPPPPVQAPPSAADAPAPPAPPVQVAPPARPQPADAGGLRANDPIGSLIRSEGQGEESRLVLGAQSALVKLGYPVKPDGADGATTRQAIREFERAHGLPLTEITPRLVRQLNAAAARSPAH